MPAPDERRCCAPANTGWNMKLPCGLAGGTGWVNSLPRPFWKCSTIIDGDSLSRLSSGWLIICMMWVAYHPGTWLTWRQRRVFSDLLSLRTGDMQRPLSFMTGCMTTHYVRKRTEYSWTQWRYWKYRAGGAGPYIVPFVSLGEANMEKIIRTEHSDMS